MYYQNYEDYMRAVLGYPIERRNVYSSYNKNNYLQFNDTNLAIQNMEEKSNYISNNINKNEGNRFLDLYPEIYKIVNPMICKICENNRAPVTRELIQKMTDEVYNNLEETNQNSTQKNSNLNNREYKEIRGSKENVVQKDARDNKENREVRETRQIMQKNNLLRDLIQILILKKLLEENRPSINPPRPPIMPRDYTDYYKF